MFNMSAKDHEQQLCLNDYLEEGPNITLHIFAVLFEYPMLFLQPIWAHFGTHHVITSIKKTVELITDANEAE